MLSRVRPIPTRRAFPGVWEEIKYLYFKAGYWMYERPRRTRAESFVKRLESILSRKRIGNEAIWALSARGLVADFYGDLRLEIYYKQLEVNQLLNLMSVTTEHPGQGPADVLRQFETLALLRSEAGQQAKALETIEECKSFADRHGLVFAEAELRGRCRFSGPADRRGS